jgi:hypothetical protein
MNELWLNQKLQLNQERSLLEKGEMERLET